MSRALAALVAVAFGTSCGHLLVLDPPDGLSVECFDDKGCPAFEDVFRAVAAFAALEPSFDPDARLSVDWFPADHVFYVNDEGQRIIGLTSTPSSLATTSFPVLFHELFHVHYWRRYGDPDRNHAKAGGQWRIDEEDRILVLAEGFQ